MAKAGFYGTRVTIHQADLDRLPYQAMWANLIVSEETLLTGKLPPSPAGVYRLLRPAAVAWC